MNIRVSGIDHESLPVAEREAYALNREAQLALLARAKNVPGVLGAVALATCNRTELYLSLADEASVEPFSLLGKAPAYTYDGRAAFDHLAALAAGLKSRLFAEDQILTQVKNALVLSREALAADSCLEVFFREAIAAAKRVKTQCRFSHGDRSAAQAAAQLVAAQEGVHAVLVIGNGEIGRAAAACLADAGLDVTMTLRQYRHGEIALPRGVRAVDYADRLRAMEGCGAVVSATTSPHYTVTAADVRALTAPPRLFLDLAMPRDLEPKIGSMPGVRLYNIDDVADVLPRAAQQQDALAQIEPLVDEGWQALSAWLAGRSQLDCPAQHSHFPLFVPTAGRTALVVGGGTIATRRVLSLAKFQFDIRVVAQTLSDTVQALAQNGRVSAECRPFADSDLDGVFLVVAATNDRAVNHHIAVLARHMGVYASVADDRDDCSFFFPAVAEDGRVIIGLCADGSAHHDVVKSAKIVREAIHEAHEHRQPGE